MFDAVIGVKIIIAALLAALIGYEREIYKKSAGLRTHILVCLASCVLMITGMIYFPTDSARIIAGIITGMGFIGAGTIIAGENKIKGITTAASLWLITIIGIIIALGAYEIAIVSTLVAFIVLELGRIRKLRKK